MTITDFSALTLHLPLLDSATLSQAWRDALQATARHPTATAMRSPAPRLHRATPMPSEPCHARASGRAAVASRQKQPIAAARVTPIGEAERARTRISGRLTVARAARPNAAPRKRETYVVTLPDGERICVMMRPHHERMRVTVLCAPHLQGEIGRALAALAASFAHAEIALEVAPYAKAM